MLDKHGLLVSLLASMRAKAAQDFISLLESIAGELETESEPSEDYRHEEAPEGFDALWADR